MGHTLSGADTGAVGCGRKEQDCTRETGYKVKANVIVQQGNSGVSSDWVFENGTSTAVKKFRVDRELITDDIVGKSSWEKLSNKKN